MGERPSSNDAQYEVQVWNVDKQEAEWSLLIVGHAVASGVDQAEEFLSQVPDDEDLRLVVVNRA